MRASLLWVYIGLAGCHRLFGLTGVESTGDTEPDARLERDGGRERDGGGEALVVFATSARLTGDMGGLSGADEA